MDMHLSKNSMISVSEDPFFIYLCLDSRRFSGIGVGKINGICCVFYPFDPVTESGSVFGLGYTTQGLSLNMVSQIIDNLAKVI